ncbi:Hypothetical protein RY67_598 [Bifidobacterium longum subsp. infantis]|uniref:Uncharacterized protein n=1 Tax=Bifidobacterium longum subsp. infantis TaxID=1682 RepID=A0A0M4LT93_BIFLI|nr:Hypothetical protein RY67_598 [Bifidobacterium longum subsp. infantis]
MFWAIVSPSTYTECIELLIVMVEEMEYVALVPRVGWMK